jgi:homoserine/homoserine lactone efflux protein
VIDIHLYLVFLFAVAVLTLIPGPNMALIVANSVSYGTRFGMLTLAGTSSAMVIQLALTGLGMTAVMGIMAQWFEWIRWVGVLYLVWLGVRLWRTPPVDLTQVAAQPRSARLIYLRGLLVSLTNPKPCSSSAPSSRSSSDPVTPRGSPPSSPCCRWASSSSFCCSTPCGRWRRAAPASGCPATGGRPIGCPADC